MELGQIHEIQASSEALTQPKETECVQTERLTASKRIKGLKSHAKPVGICATPPTDREQDTTHLLIPNPRARRKRKFFAKTRSLRVPCPMEGTRSQQARSCGC